VLRLNRKRNASSLPFICAQAHVSDSLHDYDPGMKQRRACSRMFSMSA
jgi:hypothetical protein